MEDNDFTDIVLIEKIAFAEEGDLWMYLVNRIKGLGSHIDLPPIPDLEERRVCLVEKEDDLPERTFSNVNRSIIKLTLCLTGILEIIADI